MKSFTKMLILILAIFGIAKGETLAQYVTVEFPKNSQLDVSTACNLVIRAIAPYEFRLDRIDPKDGIGHNDVVYYERRGDEIYGIVGTVGVRRSDPTNPNNANNTTPDNIAWASEFNDNLLVLSFLSPLSHSQVYDIVINNLKLYNPETNTTVTQNAILSEYFTTIKAPLRFVKTNLGNGFINCNKTIEVEFNDDLSDIDINSLIQIKSSDPPEQKYTDIHFSYTLTNNNTTVSIAPFPMDVNLLYTLFINEEIITGEANDNKHYEFVRENVYRVKINSKFYSKQFDSLYTFKNKVFPYNNDDGIVFLEGVPLEVGVNKRLNYFDSLQNRYLMLEFAYWESNNPDYNHLKSNFIDVNLSCYDVGNLALSPVYREIPYDTVVVSHDVRKYRIEFNGYAMQLNDTTFLVENGNTCSIQFFEISDNSPVPARNWKSDYPIDLSEFEEINSDTYFCFKTPTVTIGNLVYDLNSGIKIGIKPEIDFIDHPEFCSSQLLRLIVRSTKLSTVADDFFQNTDNLTILVDGQPKSWNPTYSKTIIIHCGQFDAGSTHTVSIIVNNPYHFLPIKGEQLQEYSFEVTIPYYSNYNCEVTREVPLDRYIREVKYSWILKNERDSEIPFKEYDLSLKHSIDYTSQNNVFYKAPTTKSYEYYLNNTILVTKVTKTVKVLAGTDVTIMPYRRLPEVDKLKTWVCTTYDCEDINLNNHFHTFHKVNADKDALYEFYSDGFKLLYIEIEDLDFSDADSVIMKTICDFSEETSNNSAIYMTAMHTGSRGYGSINPETLKSVGRYESIQSDPSNRLTSSMFTSSIALHFSEPVQEQSLFDTDIFSDSRKRYDKDYYGHEIPFNTYKLDYRSKIKSKGNMIILRIQDINNGLELSHLSAYTASFTRNIRSQSNKVLSNPSTITVLTEGLDIKIALDKISYLATEDAEEDELKITTGYKALFLTDKSYKEDIHYEGTYIYPFEGEQKIKANDTINFNSDHAFYRPKINKNSVIVIGGVAYDLDKGDIAKKLINSVATITSGLKNIYPGSKEIQVADIVAKALKELADSGILHDDDDQLGVFEFDLDLDNAWRTEENGFYRTNYLTKQLNKYLKVTFSFRAVPDQKASPSNP